MNKYSKRALKTTATVGMSLAMVLSGVAAPVKAAVTPGLSFCDSGTIVPAAESLMSAIKADLAADSTATPSLAKLDLKYVEHSAQLARPWTNTITLLNTGHGITTASKLSDLLGAPTKIVKTGGGQYTVQELLVELANCKKDETAILLVGSKDDHSETYDRENFPDRVVSLETALTALNGLYATNGLLANGDIVDIYNAQGVLSSSAAANYTTIKAIVDEIDAFYAKHKFNMTSATQTTLQSYYTAHIDSVKRAMDAYLEGTMTTTAPLYVQKLEALTINGVTIRDLVNTNVKFSYENLADLSTFIADLKADKIGSLKAVSSYKVVAGDSKVDKYVSELETIEEDMKTAKELISKTNKLIVTFNRSSVAAKVATLGNAANAVKTATTGPALDTAEGIYESAFNAFRSEDIETLKEYVEGVVNEFYTVYARTGTQGVVYLDLKGETLARYIEETDVVSSNLRKVLTINIDKTNEESVYDALTGKFISVEDLIKACTTDIEGLTLNSKITEKNAMIIVAAKTAYDELTDEDSTYKLTTKEKNAVKTNGVLINALYTKLIYNGTVISTGWVDKGNGNWDFFNNDGAPATKWVAASTDWYYVKGGSMLRNSWVANDATGSKWYYVDDAGKMVSNTTVNGYVFDANGVWVK